MAKCRSCSLELDQDSVDGICWHCHWDQNLSRDLTTLATCGGCGAYGPLGRTHVRNGKDCGEYV